MPIWQHVIEDLTAIISLLLMPYVVIAIGLGLALAWAKLRRGRRTISNDCNRCHRSMEVKEL
jgi:hypothetical protein